MALVATVGRPKDLEPAAAILVANAGLAPAEARMRLAPEPPAVLLRVESAGAQALAAALRAVGTPALALEEPVPEVPMARGFELGASQVTFFARDGGQTEMGYGDIRLILKGVRVFHAETKHIVSERKFALGTALLTNGLKMTKVEKREVTHKIETPAHASIVYSSSDAVLLDEAELVYQGLGEALQPARIQNFNTLVEKLRGRAAQARYDDRLLRLGPRPLSLALGDPFSVVAELLNRAQLAGLL